MISFRQIRDGWIVGVVLHNDAVESEFVPLGECLMHGDFWEFSVLCRWRWRVNDGFDISIFDQGVKLTEEQWDFVQRHIERKYNIPFDDEGHFDHKKFYEVMRSEPEEKDPDEDDSDLIFFN